MRILHLPYSWRPQPFGGTEHYVLGLWRSLLPLGIEGLVAALAPENALAAGVRSIPAPGRAPEPECVTMEDRPAAGRAFRDELYGDGSAGLAEALAALVVRRGIQLVHFHARTRFASTRLAALLGERAIPYVYTFHTPTTVCRRGDLRLEGRGACDGRMDGPRCSACWLQSKGVPRPVARGLSRWNLPVPPAGPSAFAGARRLTESRSASVRRFLEGAAGVVALCEWGRDVLLRNGVPGSRITLSRHGLDEALLSGARGMTARADEPAPPEFVFVGRADHLKGADLLLEAVRSLPGVSLRVSLYLVVQGARDEEVVRGLRRIAGDDPRVRFESEAPRESVLEALSKATACVVPSRWLETGPLVVLESFAVGTPVVGTRLGGISELVRDGENGLLFELENVPALAGALARLAGEPELRRRLRAGVTAPRSMSAVAGDMQLLYGSVLGGAA